MLILFLLANIQHFLLNLQELYNFLVAFTYKIYNFHNSKISYSNFVIIYFTFL